MKVRELKVGDEHSDVVVENLTRTQIVMYAGASGDFNPLHSDEVFATEVAGYDQVMAHGQLTMGLTGKVVTGWVDEAELTAFGVRFARQVWPGDTLTATATVTAVADGPDGATAELSILTRNQDGLDIISGYARVREG